jgi:glycosyltransferase involved in cell wall biosynthesis
MGSNVASDLSLSIVVPVYRSQAILPILVEAVRSAVADAGCLDCFELILVNDDSPDDSWRVLKELVAKHAFITAVCLTRNFGQHNAIMAGLNRAQGEVVIIMDDDMQHPPAAIGTLITAIRSGHDVCYTRYEGRKHALWKRLGSAFNDRVATWLLKKPRNIYLSSYKALSLQLVREVIKYDGPYAYIDGLILDFTQRITSVPVPHRVRFEGTGNYGLKRSVSLWLKMATSFSVLPLRVASFFGAATAGLSLVTLVVVIIQKLSHPDLPAGWASLISVVLFMGGVQLLCLGIVGEYIGRTYLKLNAKPQFAVREEIRGAAAQSQCGA